MDRQPQRSAARSLVVWPAAAVILGGLALAGLRFSNAAPPERGLEGALGSLALGAAVAATGVLALLALADRPALLLPAAIVLVPFSMLSFALVTLPLLIPASMFLVAYGRRADLASPRGSIAGVVVTVFAALFGAVVVLFAHADPRSYVTSTGGGSVGDVITLPESISSLGLTAAAILVGWALARPRPSMSHPPG